MRHACHPKLIGGGPWLWVLPGQPSEILCQNSSNTRIITKGALLLWRLCWCRGHKSRLSPCPQQPKQHWAPICSILHSECTPHVSLCLAISLTLLCTMWGSACPSLPPPSAPVKYRNVPFLRCTFLLWMTMWLKPHTSTTHLRATPFGSFAILRIKLYLQPSILPGPLTHTWSVMNILHM